MRTPAKEERKTNKQTTRASNTRKLSKHKTHTINNTKKNNSKTPAGERGMSRPTKGGKEIPTAPLRPTSHPPDPRRSREGRAISKRGVGGIPVPQPGDKRTRPERREKESDKKGPRAHCKSPRAKISKGSWVRLQP